MHRRKKNLMKKRYFITFYIFVPIFRARGLIIKNEPPSPSPLKISDE